MKNLTLQNASDRHRFEALADGNLAGYVEYSHLTRAVMLSHTEVLPQFEGKGIGSYLARESLAAVRNQGKRVIPACPFIAAYLRKHPEELDLVDTEVQKAYRI